MEPRPVDIPLARALTHLAAGRLPQAIGAFRAAIGVDPSALDARIGLADAIYGAGRRGEAVDGLVEVAESLAEQELHDDAMCLYSKALLIDPSRVDLHLDVAFVEEAMGRHEEAVVRVEGLAEHYMDDGRTDEAAELLRFLATWGEDEDEAAPVRDLGLGAAPVNTVLISGATVIARNPLLDELLASPAPVVAMTPAEASAVIPSEPEPELIEEPESIEDPVELHEAAVPVPVLDEIELAQREAESEVTVARPPSAPIVVTQEVADDMVTRIARAPQRRLEPSGWVCEASITLIPTSAPKAEEEEPEAELETVARAVVDLRPMDPPSPPAYRAAPQVPVAPREGRLRVARAPRPGAPNPARPAPSAARRPMRPAQSGRSALRDVSNPLVERLRARAGLGQAAGRPRASRIRATEPISVRQPIRIREEDVTVRVRRPRGLEAAV